MLFKHAHLRKTKNAIDDLAWIRFFWSCNSNLCKNGDRWWAHFQQTSRFFLHTSRYCQYWIIYRFIVYWFFYFFVFLSLRLFFLNGDDGSPAFNTNTPNKQKHFALLFTFASYIVLCWRFDTFGCLKRKQNTQSAKRSRKKQLVNLDKPWIKRLFFSHFSFAFFFIDCCCCCLFACLPLITFIAY